MNSEAIESALNTARKMRESGGFNFSKPHAGKHKPHLYTGPVHSSVAGRTDHLPTQVPNQSYVIPADIVSSHGEGNTIAGFKVLKRVFGGTPYGGGNGPYGQSGGPYGLALGKKHGGEVGAVPVVIAGGEMVLSPEEVARAGDGDMDMGHRVLDEWIKRTRKKLINTLQSLPGPKKD